MGDHIFISYSRRDGNEIADRLATSVQAGPKGIATWRDTDDLKTGTKFQFRIDEAIKTCRCFVYLMTPDSVREQSVCPQEVERAFRYKRPIAPVLVSSKAVPPLLLEGMQHIDFTDEFDGAIEKLRAHIAWLDTSEGRLHMAQCRCAELDRELHHANTDTERRRLLIELEQINREIDRLKVEIAQPDTIRQADEIRLSERLEEARQAVRVDHKPDRAVRFINSESFHFPAKFLDRISETRLVFRNFILDGSKRLLTIVGRGGVGKTAMTSRILKSIETGTLPDGLGTLRPDGLFWLDEAQGGAAADESNTFRVDGIVYLSNQQLRKITFPHFFEDVSKLLDAEARAQLDEVYRSGSSTNAKMSALLSAAGTRQIFVLLDNFETLIDEGRTIADAELRDALTAVLDAPTGAIRIIVTTRVAPAEFTNTFRNSYMEMALDEGLETEYAVQMLRELDADGVAGLRYGDEAELTRACDSLRGYPRALEALYFTLRDRTTTLDEVLSKAGSTLPEQVIEVMVGEAYSRLEPHAQRVMQALAVFARPVPAVAVDYLLQPFAPGIDSAPTLNYLVNMRLVHFDRDQYFLHAVDRACALSKLPAESDAPDADMNREAMCARAAAYFGEVAKEKSEWKTRADIEPNIARFELLRDAKEYDEAARVLHEFDFEYLRVWGDTQLAIEYNNQILPHLTDTFQIMSAKNSIGASCQNSGRLREAEEALRSAIELSDSVRGEHQAAAEWCNLGNVLRDMGKLDEAQKAHEAALESDGHTFMLLQLAIKRGVDANVKALFNEIVWGIGIDLHNISACLYDRGLCDEALQCVQLSIDMIPLAGKGERKVTLVRAQRLASLSRYLSASGEWHEALKTSQEAFKSAVDVSSAEAIGKAAQAVGNAAVGLEEWDLAERAIRESMAYTTPRHAFRNLLLLGIALAQKGQLDEARESFEMGLEHSNEMVELSPDNCLARMHQALTQYALFAIDARDDCQQAKTNLLELDALKENDGIRSQAVFLLEALSKLDSTRELRKAVVLLSSSGAKPNANSSNVLQHKCVIPFRMQIVPKRLSELYNAGDVEAYAKLRDANADLNEHLQPPFLTELKRTSAWVEARRGMLTGPSFLNAIENEKYVGSLLGITDQLAVYRHQGLTPAPEIWEWVDRGRTMLDDGRKHPEPFVVLFHEYHGCALLARNEVAAAREALERALQLEEQNEKANSRILARIRTALGEACRLAGDSDAARNHLEYATIFQEEHGYHGDLCEFSLPYTARLEASYDAASGVLNEALEIANALGHKKATMRILLTEARLATDTDRIGSIHHELQQLANGMPGVAGCPLWNRIHGAWDAWQAGTSEPHEAYGGI